MGAEGCGEVLGGLALEHPKASLAFYRGEWGGELAFAKQSQVSWSDHPLCPASQAIGKPFQVQTSCKG